jgi:CxxC motif-containing protein (DUF1111 family)
MASLKRRLSRLPFIAVFLTLLVAVPLVLAAVDAPTGYDNLTNGFTTQTNFDQGLAQFDTVEQISDGLGPVYNAQACRECHQNPVSGSVTQVNELRAGFTDPTSGSFTPHPGGTLINDRAINPAIQEHVFDSDNTVTFRTSISVLGDGFVEAIPDSEFTRIQNAQPSGMKGVIVTVPVLETGLDGTTPIQRIARFGWKNQHASLISFAADAYLNEMGITNPIFPNENTSNGNSVMPYDTVSDPEDPPSTAHPFGKDIEAFASFMRSTKAPPRAPAALGGGSSDPIPSGEGVFDRIGCENCHTDSITTAPAGTSFNGGFFIVDSSLGSKTFHPYSDFMLHNIKTGDGIPQGSATGDQIRTAPLWGLRTRTRLMHDGQSFTITEAILRHAKEAAPTVTAFNGLSSTDRANLLTFLNSL